MEAVTGLIITACWLIFLGYWLVNAARVKKTVERQSLPSILVHRIPLWLGVFLLIFRRLPPPMNDLIFPHTFPALVSGAAVGILGLLVCIWARHTLAGNWSSNVTFKQGHELVSRGPYRFVRHPIYTGILTMCLGTAIDTGLLRSWLAIGPIAIGFWIKLSQEERLMLRHFPDQYPLYKKQVKALIPWII